MDGINSTDTDLYSTSLPSMVLRALEGRLPMPGDSVGIPTPVELPGELVYFDITPPGTEEKPLQETESDYALDLAEMRLEEKAARAGRRGHNAKWKRRKRYRKSHGSSMAVKQFFSGDADEEYFGVANVSRTVRVSGGRRAMKHRSIDRGTKYLGNPIVVSIRHLLDDYWGLIERRRKDGNHESQIETSRRRIYSRLRTLVRNTNRDAFSVPGLVTVLDHNWEAEKK
tara:strand:- start:651 stop:1331 length:681 start_codon:yes stop_codon:yes gene_type:complete